METLFKPDEVKLRWALQQNQSYLLEKIHQAKAIPGGRVLKIVWDKAGDYPQHAWGYEQWSVRPYHLGYGCDGTTDGNVHFIAWQLCKAAGIDYPGVYAQAYPDSAGYQQEFWTPGTIAKIGDETVVPPLSDIAIRFVLRDLGEINNGMLAALLTEAFMRAGHDVENYWEHVH